MRVSVEIESRYVANISYNKLLDPVSDIITLMESMMAGAFGATTGDQRECCKRIHAYSWGLHTLVMDVITSLGIENAATRPLVLERFNALNHPAKTALDNLSAGFDGPLGEEQQATISHVIEAFQSIEQMMTNIWHYSLLRHDMLEYADDEFDGSVLIHRIRSALRDIMLPEVDTRFCAIGDEEYLSYAFGEIARNIRLHADVDMAQIKVQEFGYKTDIAILDRGRGFRATSDATVEPFWQSREADPGLGLGLYLARRHIESCGGRLQLGSRPGKGTLVKISLPCLP